MTRKQAGDTIVEVLLAIGVITAVLAGAYTTTRRNLNTSTAGREHDLGAKLAQNQVEMLKAGLTQEGFVPPVTDFCLVDSGTTVTSVASSDPQCSAATVSGAGTPFTVQVTQPDPNLYRVHVEWDRISGGTDQVDYFYRDYPL